MTPALESLALLCITKLIYAYKVLALSVYYINETFLISDTDRNSRIRFWFSALSSVFFLATLSKPVSSLVSYRSTIREYFFVCQFSQGTYLKQSIQHRVIADKHYNHGLVLVTLLHSQEKMVQSLSTHRAPRLQAFLLFFVSLHQPVYLSPIKSY